MAGAAASGRSCCQLPNSKHCVPPPATCNHFVCYLRANVLPATISSVSQGECVLACSCVFLLLFTLYKCNSGQAEQALCDWAGVQSHSLLCYRAQSLSQSTFCAASSLHLDSVKSSKKATMFRNLCVCLLHFDMKICCAHVCLGATAMPQSSPGSRSAGSSIMFAH